MDLYISSYEHDFLNSPVKVQESEVREIDGFCFMYIKLEHAISFNIDNEINILNDFFLLPRYKNKRKDNFGKYPLEVYLIDVDGISSKKKESFAWAVLYNDFEDARNHSVLEKRKGCFRIWN